VGSTCICSKPWKCLLKLFIPVTMNFLAAEVEMVLLMGHFVACGGCADDARVLKVIVTTMVSHV
jgi:hypothetical protein